MPFCNLLIELSTLVACSLRNDQTCGDSGPGIASVPDHFPRVGIVLCRVVWRDMKRWVSSMCQCVVVVVLLSFVLVHLALVIRASVSVSRLLVAVRVGVALTLALPCKSFGGSDVFE